MTTSTNRIPWEAGDTWGRLREVPRRLWRGHFSLPVAFWLYGILIGNLVMTGMFLVLVKRSEVLIKLGPGAALELRWVLWGLVVFLIVGVLYAIIENVGIWRSATRDPRGGWGMVAKVMVVISILGHIDFTAEVALRIASLVRLAEQFEEVNQRAAIALKAHTPALSPHDFATVRRILEKPLERWATIDTALLEGLRNDAVSGEQWISDATPQLKALAATVHDSSFSAAAGPRGSAVAPMTMPAATRATFSVRLLLWSRMKRVSSPLPVLSDFCNVSSYFHS